MGYSRFSPQWFPATCESCRTAKLDSGALPTWHRTLVSMSDHVFTDDDDDDPILDPGSVRDWRGEQCLRSCHPASFPHVIYVLRSDEIHGGFPISL